MTRHYCIVHSNLLLYQTTKTRKEKRRRESIIIEIVLHWMAPEKPSVPRSTIYTLRSAFKQPNKNKCSYRYRSFLSRSHSTLGTLGCTCSLKTTILYYQHWLWSSSFLNRCSRLVVSEDHRRGDGGGKFTGPVGLNKPLWFESSRPSVTMLIDDRANATKKRSIDLGRSSVSIGSYRCSTSSAAWEQGAT